MFLWMMSAITFIHFFVVVFFAWYSREIRTGLHTSLHPSKQKVRNLLNGYIKVQDWPSFTAQVYIAVLLVSFSKFLCFFILIWPILVVISRILLWCDVKWCQSFISGPLTEVHHSSCCLLSVRDGEASVHDPVFNRWEKTFLCVNLLVFKP